MRRLFYTAAWQAIIGFVIRRCIPGGGLLLHCEYMEGYRDARFRAGDMTPDELENWDELTATAAFNEVYAPTPVREGTFPMLDRMARA